MVLDVLSCFDARNWRGKYHVTSLNRNLIFSFCSNWSLCRSFCSWHGLWKTLGKTWQICGGLNAQTQCGGNGGCFMSNHDLICLIVALVGQFIVFITAPLFLVLVTKDYSFRDARIAYRTFYHFLHNAPLSLCKRLLGFLLYD